MNPNFICCVSRDTEGHVQKQGYVGWDGVKLASIENFFVILSLKESYTHISYESIENGFDHLCYLLLVSRIMLQIKADLQHIIQAETSLKFIWDF